MLYNNLIFNTDALGVLIHDALLGSIYIIACFLISFLILHLCFSIFFAFFALIIDPKDLLLFRDIKVYKGGTDWFTVYLGISMWTWICAGIGFIIIVSIKALFLYGVLRFQ